MRWVDSEDNGLLFLCHINLPMLFTCLYLYWLLCLWLPLIFCHILWNLCEIKMSRDKFLIYLVFLLCFCPSSKWLYFTKKGWWANSCKCIYKLIKHHSRMWCSACVGKIGNLGLPDSIQLPTIISLGDGLLHNVMKPSKKIPIPSSHVLLILIGYIYAIKL